jgi:hypothetical protein
VNTTPPVDRLDYQGFRRKLAGLIDPDRAQTAGEKHAVREDAHRWCCVLAHLYGVSEDRSEIWGHVTKALDTSCAKVSDCDLDRWATLCLGSVQADPVKAAACEALAGMLSAWQTWPDETLHALLNYVRSHLYAVVTHGRARWERVKKKEIDL